MIRLVVSDLDGTLLDEEKQLPPDFDEILDGLNSLGVCFATCSGRNYSTQRKMFAGREGQMSFICDNGAYVVDQGKTQFIGVISEPLWKQAAELAFEFGDNCRAILCGVSGTYVLSYQSNLVLAEVVDQFYSDLTLVEDLMDVRDTIFKVSLCNIDGTAGPMHQRYLDVLGSRANIMLTHSCFMDVMAAGVSKGSGVACLQRAHGVSLAETMAFGDYYNDIEMLQNAGESYLVEGAPEDLRRYANHTATGGVTAVIRRELLKES